MVQSVRLRVRTGGRLRLVMDTIMIEHIIESLMGYDLMDQLGDHDRAWSSIVRYHRLC